MHRCRDGKVENSHELNMRGLGKLQCTCLKNYSALPSTSLTGVIRAPPPLLFLYLLFFSQHVCKKMKFAKAKPGRKKEFTKSKAGFKWNSPNQVGD